MNNPVLSDLRRAYHTNLCNQILGFRERADSTLVFSNADDSSKTSVEIAALMVREMDLPTCPSPPKGQTAGSLFAEFTRGFLQEAFLRLAHIRPGDWGLTTEQGKLGIAAFDQYGHIADLAEVIKKNKALATALGADYLITPDIIVFRRPLADDEINRFEEIVSPNTSAASLSPLRSANFPVSAPILHASISCKWTMRSDRAQNTRTEALNLIRNRKGRTPHIAAVTFEPTANRIASIAMGTGDVDCTYHGALHELVRASEIYGNDTQIDLLNTLIEGKRLRDISDLPLDLCI